MNRKLFTNASALVLLTLGAVGSGRALTDVAGCNNKLLYGHYGFTLQGTKYPIPGVMGPTSYTRWALRWLILTATVPLNKSIR